ncbi:MAG: 23S rRNA (pseudouridine(1915)-N(3))-methyltransferase RlmH [Bacilli bacterium]|nr:23S rRNA (pseudouridine(1915)-N(3))-methyltransferase RlmH [Bacilli bacterium]
MIKIITVGHIKEKYLQDAIEEYKKRISKYTKLEIMEIKDEGIVEKEKALNIEGEKILHYIQEKDYVITLEIDGKEYNSEEFSKKIDSIQIEHSNITFIIGGSFGLSNKVKERSNLAISFSKMTFPHQLFRVILLEQIYRSYKIINNESYHK